VLAKFERLFYIFLTLTQRGLAESGHLAVRFSEHQWEECS